MQHLLKGYEGIYYFCYCVLFTELFSEQQHMVSLLILRTLLATLVFSYYT